MKPKTCTLCDKSDHNKTTCAKNPRNTFDIQADIEEECMVLNWMHIQGKSMQCNDA